MHIPKHKLSLALALLSALSAGQARAATVDCTANGPCRQLRVLGDPVDSSNFHGYADPSMRRDPQTGRLWLAYSWPHVISPWTSAATDLVELHLSYSDNNGLSWTSAGSLYPNLSVTNPIDQTLNYSSHETVNIAPAQNGLWYSVHMAYLVSPGQFIDAQLAQTGFLAVAVASSPTALASAPVAKLGFADTDPTMGVDVNLTALDPAVSGCSLFFEPALLSAGNTLFLATRCIGLKDGSDFYAVFSTHPRGPAKSWVWAYQGALTTPADAADLGAEFITQLDLARRSDGTVLAVLTPANRITLPDGSPGSASQGCGVYPVASLTQPALYRNQNHQLVNMGQVNASDLDPYGPTACTYEPTSPSGVVITRRYFTTGALGYLWSLFSSGLNP